MKHITDSDMIAFMNGELADHENKKIEQHIHQCEDCNQLAGFIQQMTAEWNNPTTQSEMDIAENVMDIINITPQLPKKKVVKKPNRWVYAHLGLAAAAAILFSQLEVIEHIVNTSSTVVGISEQVNEQTASSLQSGSEFLRNITNFITRSE